jgi:transcriptional regulator with XRE-family HTH domain
MIDFQFMGYTVSHRRLDFNRLSEVNLHHNCGMTTLGERLLARRKKLHLEQDDLAKMAKVSQTTISDLERGRNKRSKFVGQLARALRCRVDWLEKGQGPEEEGEIDPDVLAETLKHVRSYQARHDIVLPRIEDATLIARVYVYVLSRKEITDMEIQTILEEMENRYGQR